MITIHQKAITFKRVQRELSSWNTVQFKLGKYRVTFESDLDDFNTVYVHYKLEQICSVQFRLLRDAYDHALYILKKDKNRRIKK